jgi:DNA/RNA endonuclease YhcR with UshA esterase domain
MKTTFEKYKYVWIAAVVVVMIVGYYAFGGSGDTGADPSVAGSALNSTNIAGGVAATGNAAKSTEGKNSASQAPSQNNSGKYEYTEAARHVGERAAVSGTVVDTYTSQKGTVFFDFCQSYKTCPFAAMISASTLAKYPSQFSNLDDYDGKRVTVTGIIKSYQGQAEIFIDDPSQLVVDR